MVDFKGTKKFEDDTTKPVSSNLTSNQFEDAAKKIFQRATKPIRSEWRSTFTSSDSLSSTLVRLQSENELSTVHVLVKNVTENQIDQALSQLPFRRMTRVWVEIDNAIISIVPGSKHELAGGTFNSQILSAISMIPGHSLLSIAIPGATRFHCPGKRCKEGTMG